MSEYIMIEDKTKNSFEPSCKTGTFWLKFQLLNYIVEGLEKFWRHPSILGALLSKEHTFSSEWYFDVHVKGGRGRITMKVLENDQ